MHAKTRVRLIYKYKFNILHILFIQPYFTLKINGLFLDAIASLDFGYESKSVRIIKANNKYNSTLNVVY